MARACPMSRSARSDAVVQRVALLIVSVQLGCNPREEKASTTSTTGAEVSLPAPSAPFATPPVLPGTPDIPALVSSVRPGVVNITTTQELARRSSPIDPFEFFFGRKRREGGDEVLKRRALGSGFLVDGQGHVATNAHVVAGASSVRVTLSDGRELPAKVRGTDERLDLAVLELSGASDLPYLSLGSSDQTRVGEYVVAIGNPFGLGDTVTQGIVSAKGRELGAGPYDDFIQTDASINPGNSGGPLFNLKGQVIGINTAIAAEGKGIGFAIPSDAVRDVIPQLLASGRVERGRLGVAIQNVDATLAKALGLSRPFGALVSDVESGGPADKAGVKPGDVVVSVDKQPIEHAHDLPRIVARRRPGTHVAIELVTKSGRRSVNAVLDEVKDEQKATMPRSAPTHGDKHELGIGLAEDPRGAVVVVDVDPDGPAAGQLDQGDVIVEVDGVSVKSAHDVADQIRRSGDRPVLFRVRHEGRTRFVAIDRK